MKPSDITEIRRLYQENLEQCRIDRICGCYVNGEKNIVTRFSSGFYSLPEEERFKYLELFRKTLSGTRDKNLLLLEPQRVHRDDHSGDMRGEAVILLQALVETELRDEETLEDFYRKVVESYSYIDNYLILLAHQNYDVPGKTRDGLDLEDASEEVYRHILCTICPVKPTKPGLGYDASEKMFRNLEIGRMVELPMNGFLYPAFIDRSGDPDFVLYYTKDTVDIRPDFADQVLGSATPLGASSQREGFSSLLTETLGEENSLETVLDIHESLLTMLEEKKEEHESAVLDKKELGKLLRSSGLGEEQIRTMEEHFDDVFVRPVKETVLIEDGEQAGEAEPEDAASGETEAERASAISRYPEEVPIEERIFVASNLMPGRSLEVKNQDFTIKINTRRTELLETKVIDGRKCLLIRLEDGVTVNGIPITI